MANLDSGNTGGSGGSGSSSDGSSSSSSDDRVRKDQLNEAVKGDVDPGDNIDESPSPRSDNRPNQTGTPSKDQLNESVHGDVDPGDAQDESPSNTQSNNSDSGSNSEELDDGENGGILADAGQTLQDAREWDQKARNKLHDVRRDSRNAFANLTNTDGIREQIRQGRRDNQRDLARIPGDVADAYTGMQAQLDNQNVKTGPGPVLGGFSTTGGVAAVKGAKSFVDAARGVQRGTVQGSATGSRIVGGAAQSGEFVVQGVDDVVKGITAAGVLGASTTEIPVPESEPTSEIDAPAEPGTGNRQSEIDATDGTNVDELGVPQQIDERGTNEVEVPDDSQSSGSPDIAQTGSGTAAGETGSGTVGGEFGPDYPSGPTIDVGDGSEFDADEDTRTVKRRRNGTGFVRSGEVTGDGTDVSEDTGDVDQVIRDYSASIGNSLHSGTTGQTGAGAGPGTGSTPGDNTTPDNDTTPDVDGDVVVDTGNPTTPDTSNPTDNPPRNKTPPETGNPTDTGNPPEYGTPNPSQFVQPPDSPPRRMPKPDVPDLDSDDDDRRRRKRRSEFDRAFTFKVASPEDVLSGKAFDFDVDEDL